MPCGVAQNSPELGGEWSRGGAYVLSADLCEDEHRTEACGRVRASISGANGRAACGDRGDELGDETAPWSWLHRLRGSVVCAEGPARRLPQGPAHACVTAGLNSNSGHDDPSDRHLLEHQHPEYLSGTAPVAWPCPRRCTCEPLLVYQRAERSFRNTCQLLRNP